MPKKIFLMIKGNWEKLFVSIHTQILKEKSPLSYTVTLKALMWSLEFGTEAFHIIQWKHRDNCHPKLEHSSVRTWHWHSSQSLQFFLMLITVLPSSYNTDKLDQNGSQERFSSKSSIFLPLAFTCIKTVPDLLSLYSKRLSIACQKTCVPQLLLIYVPEFRDHAIVWQIWYTAHWQEEYWNILQIYVTVSCFVWKAVRCPE